MVDQKPEDIVVVVDDVSVVDPPGDTLAVIHTPPVATNGSISHFRHLSDQNRQRLFLSQPDAVPATDLSAHGTAWVTGALLYIPGNRMTLVDDVERATAWGATSLVLDAEDSVEESAHAQTIVNIAATVDDLFYDCDEPLGISLYVRVPRTPDIWQLATHLNDNCRHLVGVILPKADASDVTEADIILDRVYQEFGAKWQLGPIVETERFARADSRRGALSTMRSALNNCSAQIPWVRIGAVDFAGLYGVRRPSHQTPHELPLLAGIIADIVSVMNTPTEGFPVAGPVCEVLDTAQRQAAHRSAIPAKVARKSFDTYTLVRETQQDIASGMVGKSVIHPAQGIAVNALLPVTSDDYLDAKSISSRAQAVSRSVDGSRMNEAAPHMLWAERTLERARVCGVLKPHITHAHVWEASTRDAHRRWGTYT